MNAVVEMVGFWWHVVVGYGAWTSPRHLPPMLDEAAAYLASREARDGFVGPVGDAVKRGADLKTGPRPAGGYEARKGSRRNTAEQPRDEVLVE